MRSPLSMSSAGPINKLTIPPFYEPIDTVCGGSGSLTSEEETNLRILRARLHHDRYCFSVHLSIIDHEDCSRSLPWIWKKAFDSMLYVLCMNMGLLALLVFSFLFGVRMWMSYIAWERHVPCHGFFWSPYLLFACCVVLLRARQSGYKDREHMADGWLV